MRCRICRLDNPEGMDFCIECGNPFRNPCPSCGFDCPPLAKFCGKCAAPLAAQAPAAVREPAPEAERRQLTVMFCDLVGFTNLSQRIDPESLRDMVRAYQETCAGAIRTFGGEIAQLLGDGLLVYFGYPLAHEDDPIRAVSAARGIVDALPRLNADLGERFPVLREHPLEVRIGIHTGPVVVGEMGGGEKQELLALGDTVNLSSRLLGAAEPGWVVISDATRRLARGVFVLQDLGPTSLKGIADPVRIHRVLQRSGVQDRLELAAATGLTPLVGRRQEVALLLDRWEQVNDRQGNVVLLEGEAGMGKSRLVRVLHEQLGDERHTWLDCRCSAYHENSAFHPVIELLRQGLLICQEDSTEERVTKLERGLSGVGFSLPDVLPLFAALLSIPLPERYAPLALSSDTLRRKTLEALSDWLFGLAELQPVILVVEDLHWIDPSSLELLGTLVEQIPTAPILLLLTFRPDFKPPWTRRSHLSHLTLHPLTHRQAATMAETIAGGEKLPGEVIEQVVARTDGVPLYVEEFMKSVLETNLLQEGDHGHALKGSIRELAVPSTLQDSLMARLDRLGPFKEVAQLAAVAGREFSYGLLAAVSPLGEPLLDRGLAQLVGAELLYQRGTPPRAVYSFKHVLIQETAYQSLLRSKRQEYHARIARALESHFPERVISHPEELARHFTEAGLIAQAVSYCQRAGELASQRSAHTEAIGHLTKGIELIGSLPESAERNQQELLLQVTRGALLQLAQGYASPEAEQAYGRARALCQGIGEFPELSRALWGLSAFYQARGELGTALELARQLLDLGGRPSLLVWAHVAMVGPLYWLGKPAEALDHFEKAEALYDPAEHGALAHIYGQDQGVGARSFAALALWQLGYPDRALRRSLEAVELGRKGEHPFSLAFALGFASVLHQMRRERDRARERAEETIAIAEQRGFPLELRLGTVMRSWALADAHGGDEGVEGLQAALAELATTGAQVGGQYFLGLMAEAASGAGRREEALGYLETALVLSESQQSRFWDAELFRRKGDLLLEAGDGSEAEAESLFRRALEVSRSQNTKSLELRAALSLGRLLEKQGKPDEARSLLEGVYGWFTEGFDTPDLLDANALMAGLSRAGAASSRARAADPRP